MENKLQIISNEVGTTFIKKMKLQPTIRNLMENGNHTKQIIGALNYCALLDGIKEPINPLIAKDVIDLFETKFAGLRIVEIYKAFSMERGQELPPKYEHYQQFNKAYVSSVLMKYQDWRQKENRRLAEIEARKEPIITDEIRRQNSITLIENVYRDAHQNKVNLGANIMFERMEAKGMIKISTEEKKALFDHVKREMAAEKKKRLLGQPFNIDLKRTIEAISEGKHNQNIKEQCRRLVVSKVMREYSEVSEVLAILIEKPEEKTAKK
jgi:hypothetical protein